jgi:hydrogenase-4 component B
MTPLFAAALAVYTLSALAALCLPATARRAAAGAGTALAGAATCVLGIAAVLGHGFAFDVPGLIPLTGARFEVDALGGLFMALCGFVTVCAAVYGVGYTRPGLDGRAFQATVPLFAAAMTAVCAASSVTTFLFAWELMALTSLLLVVAEHRRNPKAARSGAWYAGLTHAGFVAVLTGLAWLAADAGGETFAALRGADLDGPARDLAFVLAFLGFASKAGIVPLHVWLPRAHPEAPSHVSAMMSAAMVNLGVYGIVRVGLDLLGGGPAWWWLAAGGLGVASAVYGVLQAVVASDLKRLLAYSTTENMGLVLIGFAASGYLAANGSPALSALAATAAMLHLTGHAAFKTLLFLAAGSVLHATGTRNLDDLGGLAVRMRATAALFALGALGATALPPGNGFASEWLLLQGLIGAVPEGGPAAAVAMPVAVAAIALSTGLAIAAFVKAYGTGFLARPRTEAAERAHEAGPAMLTGMGTAALACVALALGPTWVVPALARVAGTEAGTDPLYLTGVGSTVSPLLIAGGLLVAAALLVVGVRARAARRAARLWDCGAGPASARMEYTATSFAEPVQRVFDDVLTPESDIDVTHTRESEYLVDRVEFAVRVPDRIERRLYQPVIDAARALGERARTLADGSIHRYLAYGFTAFCAVLIALAVMR